METYMRDLQSLMRRFYVVLPRPLAFIVFDSALSTLLAHDHLTQRAYQYLVRLNQAYSDLIGGDYDNS